jgi:hypothetical protein
MQLKAKLIQQLPIQTGTSTNGEWKKQEIIIETEEQYPRKICILIWGEKVNNNQLQIGNRLSIDMDIESKEYNGKWYTSIKARKIEVLDIATITTPENPISTGDFIKDNEEDILPF